jgi:hypothetical protein
VTRHQLYEGPGVPKTARNSAAAIEIVAVASADSVFRFACGVIERESIPGSDPGIAMLALQGRPSLLAYAETTQCELVTKEQAHRVADREGMMLAGLGGDNGGVIGALAAVGLRVGGCDGRYVGLRGIRAVAGLCAVGDVLSQTAIAAVVDEATGYQLPAETVVDLGDWVRPRLIDRQPVLVATRDGERWSNADARPH